MGPADIRAGEVVGSLTVTRINGGGGVDWGGGGGAERYKTTRSNMRALTRIVDGVGAAFLFTLLF